MEKANIYIYIYYHVCPSGSVWFGVSQIKESLKCSLNDFLILPKHIMLQILSNASLIESRAKLSIKAFLSFPHKLKAPKSLDIRCRSISICLLVWRFEKSLLPTNNRPVLSANITPSALSTHSSKYSFTESKNEKLEEITDSWRCWKRRR